MNRVTDVFNRYAADYDRWFDENPDVFEVQLAHIRPLIPCNGTGLEIGAGSGRFGSGLGILHGLDPSPTLLGMARKRGVETVLGAGEHLPYRAGTFDYVLMVTVICFMEDIDRSFREAFRVIRPGGILVIGFLEKNGEVAMHEQAREPAGRFLHHATFRSQKEVMSALSAAGYSDCTFVENLHGFCIVTARKA